MRALMACVLAASTAAAAATYRPSATDVAPNVVESAGEEIVLSNSPAVKQNFGWVQVVRKPKATLSEPVQEIPAIVQPVKQTLSKPALQRRVTCGPGGCQVT